MDAVRIGLSRWTTRKLEEPGPYRWRRLFCHRRVALVWIVWEPK